MLTKGRKPWTCNLHVNQGGKLTLRTDWNRPLLNPGYLDLRNLTLWIAPVPARLTCKKLLIIAALACENIRFSSLFVARDVPSGEERGETDVFAGYSGARRILWITYFKLSILQKSCSESSLLTTNVRGPWIQSSRPRNFKLSVKRTVDNNSYIRKNEKRLLNTSHFIHTCNWCWTWKSLDLRSAAIVRLLPLSSFSVSVSS